MGACILAADWTVYRTQIYNLSYSFSRQILRPYVAAYNVRVVRCHTKSTTITFGKLRVTLRHVCAASKEANADFYLHTYNVSGASGRMTRA
ncbi:MAG: hypothetical protein U0Y68_08820 [Blastocatellia bacterium]